MGKKEKTRGKRKSRQNKMPSELKQAMGKAHVATRRARGGASAAGAVTCLTLQWSASGQSEGRGYLSRRYPRGSRGEGLVPVLRSSESGTPGVGFGGYLQGGVVQVAKLTRAATREVPRGMSRVCGEATRRATVRPTGVAVAVVWARVFFWMLEPKSEMQNAAVDTWRAKDSVDWRCDSKKGDCENNRCWFSNALTTFAKTESKNDSTGGSFFFSVCSFWRFECPPKWSIIG